MTGLEFVKLVEKLAVRYRKEGVLESIKRNHHMNRYSGEVVSQETIDAILVDFVNFVASAQCIDYGMYTADLPDFSKEKEHEGSIATVRRELQYAGILDDHSYRSQKNKKDREK